MNRAQLVLLLGLTWVTKYTNSHFLGLLTHQRLHFLDEQFQFTNPKMLYEAV